MKPRPLSVYLSGPMSGYPDFNFPAFHEAAARLRAAGFPTINPADFGAKDSQSWRDCLARDLAALVHCDVVAVLPGWLTSKGARLEVHVAKALGMPVYNCEDMIGFGVEAVEYVIGHLERIRDRTP